MIAVKNSEAPESAIWPPSSITLLVALAGIAVLTIVGVALFRAGRRDRIEDPSRVRRFLNALSGLAWDPPSSHASLDALYDAATTLFEAEISYYYRVRTTRRLLVVVTRSGAFLFATLGSFSPSSRPPFPPWRA